MARPKKNTNTQALADKMRKAVLQAAIEGKLTEQHPATDGYARDLLADIESEKQRLFEAGEIKRQKSLSDITEEEQPFNIPDNWEWVRLGEVVEVNPRNQAEDNLEAAFVPMKFIEDQYKNSLTFEVKKWAKIKKGYTHFAKNDVVLAKITPCFQNLKSAIIPDIPNGIGAGTTEIHVLRNFANHIDLEYLLYFVKNPIFINNGVATFTGTAGQQRIGTDFVKEYLFPLPPIAEQQRIAATIKEVFLQIESLHADENALYTLQTAFPKQMQASLLQAAIEGKLTQQDATKDGNASDLLADIESEKQRLIKAGEIKREKSPTLINEEEKPFDIPDNWEWVRLGSLGYSQTGTTPPTLNKEYFGNYIPFVKPADISNSKIEISDSGLSELGIKKSRLIRKNSLLMVCIGGSIGKVYFNSTDVCCNQQINTIAPLKIVTHFLLYTLQSEYFQSNLSLVSTGTATPIVNKENWRQILVPLPPLAEQQRIVDLLEQALPEIQTLKQIQQ